MRLPFFRSSKAESSKTTAVAPPLATTCTDLPLAETQRIPSPIHSERFSQPSTSDGVEARRAPANGGQTIPISLSAISQQLPPNFLAAVDSASVARASVNIPADWILPQLTKGRI